jgi:signal transduction histidine kinase
MVREPTATAYPAGIAPGADQDATPDQRLRRHPRAPDALVLEEFPVRRWPEQRVVVLACAAFLMLGAFLASVLSEPALDELAVVYAVPVTLAGLELGVRGGAGGAAIAITLLFAASVHHSELGALGLAASATVFLMAGALAGRFSERMRASNYQRERLLTSGLRLARLEGLDALPMVLARELEQVLDVASVQVELLGAPALVVGNPGDETLRVPISANGVVFGSLTLGLPAGRSFTPEDRVVAAKLAVQAAVAAENQRLLDSERERAALRAELKHTRKRLASHLENVSQILDSQEAERRDIARQLHEQAAQAMAGVVLGLQVLERDLDQELTRKQLEEVREVARATLADLRQLAVSVRPPSLDDLGLRSALEGIAERETAGGVRRITLRCDDCPGDLPPELETCAYHVVEDAIKVLDGPLVVQLNVDPDRNRLRIELRSRCLYRHEQLSNLATARARLELIGGTLHTSSNGTDRISIAAELPLRDRFLSDDAFEASPRPHSTDDRHPCDTPWD